MMGEGGNAAPKADMGLNSTPRRNAILWRWWKVIPLDIAEQKMSYSDYLSADAFSGRSSVHGGAMHLKD